VLCGYFDYVNNQILSLGFFEKKGKKKISELKGPWDHPVISKSQRIFTSFIKELAKKEARGCWTVSFHYYFICFVCFREWQFYCRTSSLIS